MGQAAVSNVSSRHYAVPPCVRQLQVAHADLAREFGDALSRLLRSSTAVNLAGVDAATYGEFAYPLKTPACFFVIKAEPLNERLMLDVEPALLYAMIDRLLGGGSDEEPPPDRPLSEVELSLASRIVGLFLEECGRPWKHPDLRLEILQVESNPKLVRILPADEPVAVSRFEVTLGSRRGLMQFCMPYRAIERIGGENSGNCRPNENDFASDIRVVLATTQITAGDLASLQVGDIIATETPIENPATVVIDGIERFQAKPGSYQQCKAVRLIKTLDDTPNS